MKNTDSSEPCAMEKSHAGSGWPVHPFYKVVSTFHYITKALSPCTPPILYWTLFLGISWSLRFIRLVPSKGVYPAQKSTLRAVGANASVREVPEELATCRCRVPVELLKKMKTTRQKKRMLQHASRSNFSCASDSVVQSPDRARCGWNCFALG